MVHSYNLDRASSGASDASREHDPLLLLPTPIYIKLYFWSSELNPFTIFSLSAGGGSSCGRLWCCSCRVLCGVVLVVCLCV